MARVWSLNQGSDLGFDRLVLIGATEFRKVWHKDLRYRENSSVLEDTEGCESKKKKKGGREMRSSQRVKNTTALNRSAGFNRVNKGNVV